MSNKQHLENLSEIRNIMERNSRFLSLSGMSGISAGISALVGAWFAQTRLEGEFSILDQRNLKLLERDLILIAAGVLISALAFAYFFTWRKAQKSEQKVWNKTSKQILLNLSIPLLTGGVVALALLKYDLYVLVAPITLIFYGLACIHASSKTVRDIFYLGLTCLLLGLGNLFFLGYGITFWSLGFGVAHVVYGALMYFKYDRKA